MSSLETKSKEVRFISSPISEGITPEKFPNFYVVCIEARQGLKKYFHIANRNFDKKQN